MAINKITAPLATAPNVFAAPVINHLNAHAINVNPIVKIANGYIKQGAIFSIGGELFVADEDTAISGTALDAHFVKLTVSGTTANASYVSSSTGITWNGSYHGFYDVSGNYYEPVWHKNAGVDLTPIPGMFDFTRNTTHHPNTTFLADGGWSASMYCTIYGSAKIHAIGLDSGLDITVQLSRIKDGVSELLSVTTGLPEQSFMLEPGYIYKIYIGSYSWVECRGCGFVGEIAIGV
jgi:hypothetical protein